MPVLSWVEPFLPLLGLPEVLVDRPSALNGLPQQLRASYDEGFQAATQPVFFEAESQIIRRSLTQALEELASRTSDRVAMDFELWARRHFINNKIQETLAAWRAIFCASDRPKPEKSSHLSTRLVEANAAALKRKSKELDIEVQRVAPPPTQEEAESGLDYSEYGYMILSIANAEWTIQSLNILANNLSPSERDELLEWAKKVADHIALDVESLQGERYLQQKKPWLDLPTILTGEFN